MRGSDGAGCEKLGKPLYVHNELHVEKITPILDKQMTVLLKNVLLHYKIKIDNSVSNDIIYTYWLWVLVTIRKLLLVDFIMESSSI